MMTCEYCGHEHPADHMADPNYCVARLMDAVERLEAALADREKRIGELEARLSAMHALDPDGDFPSYGELALMFSEKCNDNAKLTAERDALKQKFEDERRACEWTQEQCNSAQDDYEKLTAEVGRLRIIIADLMSTITCSPKISIGSIDNIYEARFAVEKIERLQAALKEAV